MNVHNENRSRTGVDCAPPGMLRFPTASPQTPELPARCIFANHCLRIRLLGVPGGCDLGKWFEGCTGMLMVSHGSLQLRRETDAAKLSEGDSISLPLEGGTELWPEKGANVLFFERQNHCGEAGKA